MNDPAQCKPRNGSSAMVRRRSSSASKCVIPARSIGGENELNETPNDDDIAPKAVERTYQRDIREYITIDPLEDTMDERGETSKDSGNCSSEFTLSSSWGQGSQGSRALPARSASVSNISTCSFSISTLRFEDAELIGRGNEIKTLKDALSRVRGSASRSESILSAIQSINEEDIEEDEEVGSKSTQNHDANENDSTNKGRAELILVHGCAGSGKTSLVSELCFTISQARRGSNVSQLSNSGVDSGSGGTLFASGKFDQVMCNRSSRGSGVPFSAFADAFVELVDTLMVLRRSAPQVFWDILEKVRRAVPGQAEVNALQTVVPNLDVLLACEKDENAQAADVKDEVVRSPDRTKAKTSRERRRASHQEGARRRASHQGGDRRRASAPYDSPSMRFSLETHDLESMDFSGSFSSMSAQRSFSSYSRSALGDELDKGGFDGGRNKNALYFLVRRFVRAVSSSADVFPVVLVLDDLHWADNSSLDLLVNLATDREIVGLLLVGCYRDENPTASLDESVEEIKRCNVFRVSDISLANLTVDDVNELLGELLSSHDSKLSDLATVVHQKTDGNAFFVRQFLTSLYDQDLLKFNFGIMTWQYDVDVIRSETSIADNVAGLMEDKIRTKLPQPARDVLQLAACFGSTFDEKLVVVISNHLNSKDIEPRQSEEDPLSVEGRDDPQSVEDREDHHLVNDEVDRVNANLQLCVQEGLLKEALHGTGRASSARKQYRFTHDHVKNAAFSLIPECNRGLFQLRMGEVLVQELSDEYLEDCIFVVTDLWNNGEEFIHPTAEEKRLSLAILNLRAGMKAVNASAFSRAMDYLRTGINVLKSLGPASYYWDSHRELSLDLFGEAADAAFCGGQMEEMQAFVNEVLDQTNLAFDDKIRAYSTLVRSQGAQNKLPEAIETSLFLLRELGIKFPSRGLKLALFKDLMKTKKLLENYNKDSLLELPILEDKQMIIAARIMDNLLTYTYAVNQELMVLIILKMVRRTVKYGVCKYSSSAFGGFGNLIAGLLGDLRKGHMYAKVGLALYRKLGSKEMEARTVFIAYNFVLHWNEPLHLSFKPYLRGYQSGLETGDLENAMFCITYHCNVAMHTGRRLSAVVADFESYAQQMKDFKLGWNYQITVVPWQVALNLMGDSADPVVLTGKAMDQEAVLAAGEQIPFLRNLTCTARMMLAYYFGNYELAWKMVEATQDLSKTNLGQSVVWRSALFEGLTGFALARKTGAKVWKRRGLNVMKRVKKWISNGNLNCVHILFLLEAERASLAGRSEESRKAYDQAISSAARLGFSNDVALANECAGTYFLSVSRSSDTEENEAGASFWASHYLTCAHHIYTEWEAWAKASQLKELHPDVLGDRDAFNHPERKIPRNRTV